MHRVILWMVAALVMALAPAHGVVAQEPGAKLLDGFEDAASWRVITADGVSLRTSGEAGRNGRCVRLDYDFRRGSGYAIIRKELPLDLSANYRFTYAIRGEGPSNTVEFKLIDDSGDNVWWCNQRDFHFPTSWKYVVIPKRRIEFAWGPSGGKPLGHVRFVEVVITSFNGGKGTVWLDDLRFEPLAEVVPYSSTPRIAASSFTGAQPPVLDPGSEGLLGWTSSPTDDHPVLTIDFGQVRELGGLIIGWGEEHPDDFDVLVSADGARFERAYSVRSCSGDSSYIVLPDAAARAIRLEVLHTSHGRGVSTHSVRVMPVEFADSPNEVLKAAAAEAQGTYPGYWRKRATYWTVVGAGLNEKKALVGEEGEVELDKGAMSIQPFVFFENPVDRFVGGLLRSQTTDVGNPPWSNHAPPESWTSHRLEEGFMPIPHVVQTVAGRLDFDTTAFVAGWGNWATLNVKYELVNIGDQRLKGTLFLAIRPMQVNPTYQSLNITGGFAPIRHLRWSEGRILADDRVVIPMVAPDRFGATTFDSGEIASHIARGELPASTDVEDPAFLASGALAYRFDLGPGESKTVGLLAPMNAEGKWPVPRNGLPELEKRLRETREYWSETTGRVGIRLPKGNEQITDTIRANLAYMLINRNSAALQPGSRCYDRAWIRDGALMSGALLSMGLPDPVREFLDWYGPFQYENGKVPCVVDRRGPDPVPENDSNGEYIHAVRLYVAFTGDVEFLKRHYPRVVKAVAYIESLRSQRMGEEYERGPDEKRVLRGLMPESISHEGYSAKPMHSYWDDFWTLRGLIDAAELAERMGEKGDAARFGALRESFERTLGESVRLAMAMKHIEYVPGCAELGDFDATSTTVALAPGAHPELLPPGAIDATFDRYWKFFQDRRDGKLEWKDYTPYELRIVGSMVLLGQRERAWEMLRFFLQDQRPIGWRQWPEVIRKNPREPGFIGDLPHTWVGADYINSVRMMLAYTRERDGALVLGAGLPRDWLEAADGVRVDGLRTEFGAVSYSASGDKRRVRIEVHPPLHAPSGGIWFAVPDIGVVRELSVNGAARAVPEDGPIQLPLTSPSVLEVRYVGARD